MLNDELSSNLMVFQNAILKFTKLYTLNYFKSSPCIHCEYTWKVVNIFSRTMTGENGCFLSVLCKVITCQISPNLSVSPLSVCLAFRVSAS